MSLVTLVLKSLEGGVKVLERDIERASNKIVALNSKAVKVANKNADIINYYNELIDEARRNHQKELVEISSIIADTSVRRAMSTKLKNAISKLINGEV